jgi:DNA-binding transcriptional regulator YhcF (GntR family)
VNIKDYFGCKIAKRFRFNTKGIAQREALVTKMLAGAGVRRAKTAIVVYEHLLYQIASTSCPQGPWTSSVALAARTGLEPDAVTRALRTLRNVGLIAWKKYKRDGAPTRHFNLLSRARNLLRDALRSIRQIKQPEPPNPLTTYQSLEALQIASAKQRQKTVTEPPKIVVERQRGIGREALSLLRQAMGGRTHG